MKRCADCRETKPESEFQRDSWKPDGLRAYCKYCERKAAKDRRKKDGGRKAGLHKKWLAENPEKAAEYARRNRERNAKKCKARRAVGLALLSGKLTKPDKCELCPEVEEIQGHHDDYDKPLEVRWVCRGCHANIHWAEKNAVADRIL